MSDYETTQRKRNIIVGLFVIVAMCALLIMIMMFGEVSPAASKLLGRSFQVFVQFPTAPGVDEGTPVQFCGVQIGKVLKVMAPQIREDLQTHLKYHQALVVLSIDRRYVNIPSNVEVKLMMRGLGSSYVVIREDPNKPRKPLDPNRPETEFLGHEMLLQGSTGMTSEFFPEESQKKFEDLADSFNSLIKSANNIIGDPNSQKNLGRTLANLSKATDQLTKALEEFQKLSTAGTNMSEELSKTLVKLQLALDKINNGQGTAAKLINDGRLYEDLLELSEELKKFIAESRKKGVPLKLKLF